MRFFLFITILLSISFFGFSQLKTDTENKAGSIAPFNENRNIVFIKSVQYKNQFSKCMASYPEIVYQKILIKAGKIRTTMATRPVFTSIFRRKKYRKYVMFINNDSSKIKEVLLHKLPYLAQIGVIGHEMAHIYDYSQKSTFQIIGTGLKYILKKKRRNFEHQIDSITIAHNLGRELFIFSDFVLNRSNVDTNYKEYKRYIYMKPDEIEEQIKKQQKNSY